MTDILKKHVEERLRPILAHYTPWAGEYVINEILVKPFGWISIEDLREKGDFWRDGINKMGTSFHGPSDMTHAIVKYIKDWGVTSFNLKLTRPDGSLVYPDLYLDHQITEVPFKRMTSWEVQQEMDLCRKKIDLLERIQIFQESDSIHDEIFAASYERFYRSIQ